MSCKTEPIDTAKGVRLRAVPGRHRRGADGQAVPSGRALDLGEVSFDADMRITPLKQVGGLRLLPCARCRGPLRTASFISDGAVISQARLTLIRSF